MIRKLPQLLLLLLLLETRVSYPLLVRQRRPWQRPPFRHLQPMSRDLYRRRVRVVARFAILVDGAARLSHSCVIFRSALSAHICMRSSTSCSGFGAFSSRPSRYVSLVRASPERLLASSVMRSRKQLPRPQGVLEVPCHQNGFSRHRRRLGVPGPLLKGASASRSETA